MEEKLLADDTSDKHRPPRWEELLDVETFSGLLIIALLVVFPCHLLYALLTIDTSVLRDPQVSVTVDRVAGLDSRRVPRAFNLTLKIDNAGVGHEECVGGEAVVLYGGVPLATGVVRDLCVPSNGTGKVAVFAGSAGVGLPTELAELIADEKRDGGAVQLEIRVMSLKYSFLRCTAAANLQGGTTEEPQPPCDRLVLRDESDGVQQTTDSFPN
jgi:hypothetical protein